MHHLKEVPIQALRSSQQALKGQSSHLWLRMMSQFGILSSSLHLKLVEAIPRARGRIGPGNSPEALDARGVKSHTHRARGSVLLATEGTQRQALRSGAPHGMTMHGDPQTSTGLPLKLGKCQPKEATEETVGPTIASQGSEMATATMRTTQAEGMLVGGTRREVEAEGHHLDKTNKQDVMLGGSPDKIMYLASSEPASNDKEMKT